ncbi:MAG: hypothetical protein AAGH87_04625 [Pseudomonadota bacterium]
MAFENATLILLGVYCLGGGIALLLNPARMGAMFAALGQAPGVSYLSGAILAPLGAGVLLAVHDFDTAKRGFVTVFGAVLLLKGWLIMVAPRALVSGAAAVSSQASVLRASGAVSLVLGGLLLWLGHTA